MQPHAWDKAATVWMVLLVGCARPIVSEPAAWGESQRLVDDARYDEAIAALAPLQTRDDAWGEVARVRMAWLRVLAPAETWPMPTAPDGAAVREVTGRGSVREISEPSDPDGVRIVDEHTAEWLHRGTAREFTSTTGFLAARAIGDRLVTVEGRATQYCPQNDSISGVDRTLRVRAADGAGEIRRPPFDIALCDDEPPHDLLAVDGEHVAFTEHGQTTIYDVPDPPDTRKPSINVGQSQWQRAASGRLLVIGSEQATLVDLGSASVLGRRATPAGVVAGDPADGRVYSWTTGRLVAWPLAPTPAATEQVLTDPATAFSLSVLGGDTLYYIVNDTLHAHDLLANTDTVPILPGWIAGRIDQLDADASGRLLMSRHADLLDMDDIRRGEKTDGDFVWIGRPGVTEGVGYLPRSTYARLGTRAGTVLLDGREFPLAAAPPARLADPCNQEIDRRREVSRFDEDPPARDDEVTWASWVAALHRWSGANDFHDLLEGLCREHAHEVTGDVITIHLPDARLRSESTGTRLLDRDGRDYPLPEVAGMDHLITVRTDGRWALRRSVGSIELVSLLAGAIVSAPIPVDTSTVGFSADGRRIYVVESTRVGVIPLAPPLPD